MSLYNILFGRNAHSALLLAVIGLKEHDVPRFRNVSAGDGGKTIEIYTRMGGGNRGHWDSYEGDGGEACECPGCRAKWVLVRHPLYLNDEDDDFDCTYATYTFSTPPEFVEDVANLSDPLAHGLRAEFARHLSKTLRREPTEGDKEQAAYEAEKAELARVGNHVLANGHTLVPYNDVALKIALNLAEENGGSLRTAWGILPLRLLVKTDHHPYPNAKVSEGRDNLERVRIDYEWKIDRDYWRHMQERFGETHPLSMAKIAESVASHLAKEPVGAPQ
jgi:hypothetical protein